jgi:hypothetical protein
LLGNRAVTRFYNIRGSGVFCDTWSVPNVYRRTCKIAWSSTVPKNQENGDTAEFNRDYRIWIWKSSTESQNKENGKTTEYENWASWKIAKGIQ